MQVSGYVGIQIDRYLSWENWKARALNELFLVQGVVGESGRISAATIRHGESGAGRRADWEWGAGCAIGLAYETTSYVQATGKGAVHKISTHRKWRGMASDSFR